MTAISIRDIVLKKYVKIHLVNDLITVKDVNE